MDVPEARAVTGGHVLVERVDGVGAGHLAVLLVHVVGAGARVVADPDTEVLDLQGVLLVDLSHLSIPPTYASSLHTSSSSPTHLVQADDLTVGLLDLAQLGKEVPETGLGDNIVRRKDTHAVELWGRVGIRGQMAPNDLVLCETSCGYVRNMLGHVDECYPLLCLSHAFLIFHLLLS